MAMPSMPGSALVVVEPEFVFRGLKTVLDRPPMAFDRHQRLADAVLAQRLNWPAPVPLLAGQVRRGELRAAPQHGDGDSGWLTSCALAYARAAAGAADLYADLARRAAKLAAVAPKLRGKDADEMVAILLMEDAQPAGAGQAASDRSTRRLFERLVALGAVRELTGRSSFRLYGL